MSAIFSGRDDPADMQRAVFVDKDGTLVDDVPHNVDPARLRFTPHALEGLRLLAANGYRLIVVSNQPGLAYGMFTRAQLTQLQLALVEMMQRDGVHLTDFYACTHAPGPAGRVAACLCRKPAPGLLHQAARAHHVDLRRSWMVGDTLDDIEAGRRAGCRSVLMDVGNETVWRMSPLRTPHHRAANLLEAAHTILAADHEGTPDEPAHEESLAPSVDESPPFAGPAPGPLRRAVSALQAASSLGRFS
jgi:histidinol-phosphate phosphatase family protein